MRSEAGSRGALSAVQSGEVALRIGRSVKLRLSMRMTTGGLLAVAVLASGAILSSAALVRASRVRA